MQCTHTQLSYVYIYTFIFSHCCTPDATGWVKKVSELEYAKQGGTFGGSGKEPAVSVPTMSKQPWWKPKHKALSSRAQETGDDETFASTATETPTSARVAPIALVSTVVAISVYSTHLYFRNRDLIM
jgi:hypothetical protein